MAIRTTPSNHRERVRDGLLSQITAGHFPVGTRLAPIREIARDFGVSTQPVVQALGDLEAQGYVRRRHGSGTEVIGDAPPLRMRDAIMLCLEASEHLFGELTSRMAQRLMVDGMMPTIVDIGGRHRGSRQPLRRALASESNLFVIHGQPHFPFDDIVPAARAGRKVIGVVDWHTHLEVPGAHRVLADHATGGRLVADQLWDQGHRCVLVVAPQQMLRSLSSDAPYSSTPGFGFHQRWHELGGDLHAVGGDTSTPAKLAFDADALRTALRSTPTPTAVFGLQDFAITCARPALRSIAPRAAHDLAWVGYGHTPWSTAGPAPFPTVDLNLGLIAEHAVEAIEAIHRGYAPLGDEPVWIEPEYVEPSDATTRHHVSRSPISSDPVESLSPKEGV